MAQERDTDGKKVRLKTLSDLDNRYAAAKQARALVDQLTADAGGPEQLSAAKRQLITRAALTGALCEDLETNWVEGRPIEIAAYASLVRTQVRLFAVIGIERQPRDVTSPDSARRFEAFARAFEEATP